MKDTPTGFMLACFCLRAPLTVLNTAVAFSKSIGYLSNTSCGSDRRLDNRLSVEEGKCNFQIAHATNIRLSSKDNQIAGNLGNVMGNYVKESAIQKLSDTSFLSFEPSSTLGYKSVIGL